MIALHTQPAHKPAPVPIQSKLHRVQMALAAGDILVLATHHTDEIDKPRTSMYPIALLYIEEINISASRVTYSLATDHLINQKTTEKSACLQLTKPLKFVTNHKGTCTLFTIDVAHGYRVHYLDFVKNKMPKLYRQLYLN